MDEREMMKKSMEESLLMAEAYERLKQNKDFLLFTEFTKKKIEELRDLLEKAKDEDLAGIRGQLAALRGLYQHFEDTLHRKEQVVADLKALED